MVLSPNGEKLATMDRSGRIVVWSFDGEPPMKLGSHVGENDGLSFVSADLLLSWTSSSLRLWDINKGKIQRNFALRHPVAAADLSESRNRIMLLHTNGLLTEIALSVQSTEDEVVKSDDLFDALGVELDGLRLKALPVRLYDRIDPNTQ
jgi:WD40 repeat protein